MCKQQQSGVHNNNVHDDNVLQSHACFPRFSLEREREGGGEGEGEGEGERDREIEETGIEAGQT